MLFDDAAATTQILQLDLSQTPRVLLVDDDELVLERLATLIRAAGFDVETAPDGTTAGLEAGADDYLGKRASSAQLLARLRTALAS